MVSKDESGSLTTILRFFCRKQSTTLLANELVVFGIKENMHNLIEELHAIGQIIDVYKNKKQKKLTLKRHTKLSKMQKIAFDYFNLAQFINS